MKFYKRKSLDKHNPMDNGFAQNISGDLLTTSKTSLQLPSGLQTDRPTALSEGQVRYNQDINEIEAYVNGIWERIRTVRPAPIVVQNLGSGNYLTTIFGPLNPEFQKSYIQGSANVMVYVDNVYQIPGLNYNLLLTEPTGGVLRTLGITPVGAIAITLSTVGYDIIPNMQVTGTGIPANTYVVEFVKEDNNVIITNPTTGQIPDNEPLTFTYSTGTYIVFSEMVPQKPVAALLGFDGYFPPSV